MRRNNTNIILTTARRTAMGCLLLLALAGSALAQSSSNPKYVIKKGDHYLAHVKVGENWVLRDVEVFHPDSCLWRSGPNVEHNYYFIDHLGKYRYLTAPLQLNGALSLSSHPGTALNNTTDNYYFYDWDHGIARGKKHNVASMADCDPNYHVPDSIGQCWEVVWLTCQSGWKMSSQYSYNPDPAYITNPAPYRYVTVTPHDEEISGESGGITDLVIGDFSLEYNNSQTISIGTVSNYTYNLTPAYTLYDFEGINRQFFVVPQESHYFYEGADHTGEPASTGYTLPVAGYAWTITGEGSEYLSFVNDPNNPTTSSNSDAPTLYYVIQNTSSSHKTATLTLTVTYDNGTTQATQTRSATVTVITECQNPEQASAPVVTFEDVTVSWLGTAQQYKVYWKKQSESVWANSVEVRDVTSCRITTGLEYGTNYEYKVSAYCGGAYLDVPSELVYAFTTKNEPHGLVYGAVFGGGRMANVGGKTEVIIINCEDISAVYGGNDIAGSVLDTVTTTSTAASATITLGVNNGDPLASYGTTQSSIGVNVGSVYGGGNGYYAYNGTSFVAADEEHTSFVVPDGGTVKAMTPSHAVGDSVWGNNSGADFTLNVPTIVNTAITVAKNDHVKVDSLFGGAKNAFLTTNEGNSATITIKGGTIFAVFGGNNFGGTQGYGKHHIEVQGTKANATSTSGYGRDFGIGYLFGGGNKVYGSTTEIEITGGRCDTVFAGGNSASVYAANLTVNCSLDSIYSNAIYSHSEGAIDSIDADYDWDGTGIYNVRALFGGNNQATMSPVPNLTLTSGSIGTVYGGGNAGDMIGQNDGEITFPDVEEINDYTFKYGTYVELNSPTILVDYLYGGCQMSNVGYSTWVKLQNGHVGTVYGGCNVSGDVGSTRVDLEATQFNPPGSTNPNENYQEVYGATYVEASGGTVYKNLFAGSNGYYHCKDSYGITYIEGINYAPGHNYVGMDVPTHNETHVIVSGTVLVKGNVYAGGNLACVGFDQKFIDHSPYSYPSLVGLASVRMSGGTVDGNVFGGGNMASIYGSNEVRVWGGSIGEATGGALYGGNDRSGKAGQISNRVLPSFYQMASDGLTSLQDPKVCTYVGVSGTPNIHTVYGGGNGLYAYFTNFDDASAYTGPLEPVVTCVEGDLPIQKDIFVDIGINGGDEGGYVANVYGGGNGVSVEGFIKVFVNVQNGGEDTRNHVGTLFGGNNEGELYTTLPDIILLHGNVGTIYGGCNKGAMTGDLTFGTYENLGSCVYLRGEYTAGGTTVQTTGRVTEAVYGGCRMNGVTNNTLVLVEGGNHHTATLYGGSDISGHVGGVSQVYMTGGAVKDVYGGGNGNYDYTSTAFSGLDAPSCANTQIDMLGGTVGATGIGNEGHIFGGGYGQLTTVTGNVTINFGVDNNVASQYPLLVGDLYGGSALGSVNTDASNNTTINVYNGTITGPVTNLAPADNIYGNIFGGGLGQKEPDIAALVYGKVYVNIGKSADANFTDLQGQATLVNCNVYGCNNQNGSPQDDVFVNVYSTAHTTTPINNTVNGNAFAILQVFGGGNQAHYAPEDNDPESNKKAHVYIYGCDNTVQYVYGGGNAADAVGVVTLIGGGHYNEIYGGGNGAVVAANIGKGGVGLNVLAGRVTYLFEGNNKNGNVVPVEQGGIGIYTPDPEALVSNFVDCGELIVESYFFGDNEAEHWGDIVHTIECEEAEDYHYTYLYAGSRWAIVYGDIKLTVCGGVIERLFGGSKGYALYNLPAHVRRFPTFAEIAQDIDDHPNQADRKYSQALLNHMGYPAGPEPDYVGRGGNIELIVMGGTIGEVIGGCDELGNVEGKITVIIDDAGNVNCPLQIGDIYGASNMTYYEPWDDENNGVYYNPTGEHADEAIQTPKVVFIKGTTGLEYDFDESETIDEDEKFEGNIYGGANQGHITSNPKVIVGDGTQGATATPISIGGSVYGGGNEGDVTGSPEVMIVPQTQTFTTTLVEPTSGQNLISVAYPRGQVVSSGASVGEDIDIRIVAKPYPYGCKFKEWSIVSGNGTITNKNALNTLFSMGTEATTLKAEFETASTYALTITSPSATQGSIIVKDCQGNDVTIGSAVNISEGAVLDIKATPATGYKFAGWSIESGSGTIVNLNSATTTFTMGNSTTPTVLKANFVEEEPEP